MNLIESLQIDAPRMTSDNTCIAKMNLTFKDGAMHVPDGDGLGVTVFDDRLEAYCVEKRTL